MKCPTDGSTLVMSDRSGIEIDYCPDCRGVWLDRGELDKIIERSSTAEIPPQDTPTDNYRNTQPRNDYKDYNHDNSHHKKRRKESFLGDLFDF
jgi:Zn-finger nucleic acid-binding protein